MYMTPIRYGNLSIPAETGSRFFRFPNKSLVEKQQFYSKKGIGNLPTTESEKNLIEC